MAEKITIREDKVELSNGRSIQHQVSVSEFACLLSGISLQGMSDEPIADNVKWNVSCGKLTVFIVEFKPEVRWIKWLSKTSPVPFGPEAISSDRKLATPYVIVKVPVFGGQIAHRVEVFYRNQPLRRLDDQLYWPNLLNVSPNAHNCTAWFCTQYLEETACKGFESALDTVTHHLWGGHFNASSEAHEGKSTFGLSEELGVDPRVTDVDRWEEASRQDARFILSIDWKPAGVTVRDLIERELASYRIKPFPVNAATIGNILLKRRKPR